MDGVAVVVGFRFLLDMIASWIPVRGPCFADVTLSRALTWLAVLLTLLPGGAPGFGSASMVHRILVAGSDDASVAGCWSGRRDGGTFRKRSR